MEPKSADSQKNTREGYIMRRLRNSKRLQAFFDRIVADKTLASNPLAWFQVFRTATRPLSEEGLCATLQKWSKRRFTGDKYERSVKIVCSPQPLLLANGEVAKKGVEISIRAPIAGRVFSFLAWYSGDGEQGRYAIFDDASTDISTMSLKPARDEGGVIRELDALSIEFIGNLLMISAFESWLENYFPNWRWVEPQTSPEIQKYHGDQTWRYALIQRKGNDLIIGLSSLSISLNVEVGVLFADESGVLTTQNYVGLVETPFELSDFLIKNFGASPDDPILSPWMLHRVVPPSNS